MFTIPAIPKNTFAYFIRVSGGKLLDTNAFIDLAHETRFNPSQICTIEKGSDAYKNVSEALALIKLSNQDEFLVKQDDIPEDV